MDKDRKKNKPTKKLPDSEVRLNQFLALQRAYTTIQSTMSIKDILPKIPETAINILEYDHAFVIIFDVDKNVQPEAAFFSKPGLELAKEVEIFAILKSI